MKNVMNLLHDLDNGTPVKNFLESKKWFSSSGFDQADLKNRIDFENIVMAGHSFGAATAITALQDPELKFRCGKCCSRA